MVRSILYADPVLTTEVAATQSKHNGSPHVSHRSEFPVQERLLNAREVAARLGVSERWVRDHTTRRSPKIRGVKLGTLMRYRHADVEEFMEKTNHFSLFLTAPAWCIMKVFSTTRTGSRNRRTKWQ
jgi:excisionase family DNA binding protein